MDETTEIKVKITGEYVSNSMKKNQAVDLSLKFKVSERSEAMKILSMVNQNIEVLARIGINKPIKLGLFNFNGWGCSRDGDVTLKLQTDRAFVDMINIDMIAAAGEEVLLFLFKCVIQLED